MNHRDSFFFFIKINCSMKNRARFTEAAWDIIWCHLNKHYVASYSLSHKPPQSVIGSRENFYCN